MESDVVVMYDTHPSNVARYLIIVHKPTGERLQIEFDRD
jgi:hypothetical protein